MPEPIRRKNHYVPVWYQRRFLPAGQTLLHFLNLDPPKITLSDGSTKTGHATSTLAPSSCFCATDLYTTTFGTSLNDEVERYLFGKIDNSGAKAVRAYVDNDLRTMHTSFSDFFEYLDAQKLRTPKGLDWIKSNYPGLSQIELMIEMQNLRQMHCTMWAEGVREIVSADQSDVKFIITDHPITVYNRALPPDAEACRYPNDPKIELIGSQTIFPLGENHCLILSNLEYINQPNRTHLTATRTNARYRGQGMGIVKTDSLIRSRQLTREEVIAVNYVLKSRAKKYIAAGEKEWLYPEKTCSLSWAQIGEVLLPRDEVWQFGGDLFVGYEDGSSYYQDAFGRTSKSHEYLRKEKKQNSLNPNANCGCGSGRKYKKCCRDVPEDQRPTWNVYSIRERNLLFCHVVADILGTGDGKSWEEVRQHINGEHVVQIHEAFSSLWPKDTDVKDLLPRPDPEIFRGVYLGALEASNIAQQVTAWAPYFDEMLLPHPFINPGYLKPGYSPIHKPAQFLQQTLKNVYILYVLEPYIEAGLVNLIPDPADMDPRYRETIWKMADDRVGDSVDFTFEDKKRNRELGHQEYMRGLKRLPEDVLARRVQKKMPHLDSEKILEVVGELKRQLKNDQLALLQPLLPGEEGAQVYVMKGFNLETSMFLAATTGSAIYTNMSTHWRHLHNHTKAGQASEPSKWNSVEEISKKMRLHLELDWTVSFRMRMTGDFGEVRTALRRVARAASENNEHSLHSQLAQDLKNAVTRTAKHATKPIGILELSLPTGGFDMNTSRRLQLMYRRSQKTSSIPMALLIKQSTIVGDAE